MTLRNIYRFTNLVGLKREWIRPTDAKAKYVEIGCADCESSAVDKTETKFKLTLPEIICRAGRQAFNGYTFLVTYHPSLKLGTIIVEGEVGQPLLEDRVLVVKDPTPPWLVRIYEMDTSLTGG